MWTESLGSPPLGGPLLLSSRRIESSNDMGKRFDALRVALALPKRRNWKTEYSVVRKELERALVRATTAEMNARRLQKAADDGYLRNADRKPSPQGDASRFEKSVDALARHSFHSGYDGHPWKCKVCKKGTRDLRHRGLPPMSSPPKPRLPNQLPASIDIGSETYQTPSERSTDGYYVSGRSLNYSASNPNRRRAFVHVFTCDNIRSRRDDSTVVVQGDPDYRRTKKTIGGWLWGPDMKAVRSMAKAHRKYTKLCDCITSERDFADNSNGQIGSLITTESES